MNTLSNVLKVEELQGSSSIGRGVDITARIANSGVTTSCVYWYVLRTTYGQDTKAYDYLIAHGCEAYMPTVTKMVLVHGKKINKKVSRLPNIFFVHGTFNEIKEFVYDNVHLPFLRFYYEKRGTRGAITRRPLIVPDRQMRSLMIVCGNLSHDVLLVPDCVKNFKKGQQVIITEGEFKGIEGRVARWHGQQRVAVIIDNLCTIATAYIPSAFLKAIED